MNLKQHRIKLNDGTCKTIVAEDYWYDEKSDFFFFRVTSTSIAMKTIALVRSSSIQLMEIVE